MSDASDAEVYQSGRRSTVRVSYSVDIVVEDVLMPISADEGDAADFELFLRGVWDDVPGDRDVLNTEVIEEEPVYEDEVPFEEVPDV